MKNKEESMIQWPLARSEGLLVESVGDEIVVYDEETKEAHCLKALAATVFEYADGSRTTSDIAELAGRRLGTPVSEPNVSDAVAQLEHAGLLKVPLLVRDGNGGGVSR